MSMPEYAGRVSFQSSSCARAIVPLATSPRDPKGDIARWRRRWHVSLPKVSPAICHKRRCMPLSQHRCNGGPWCWCRRCRRKKVPGAYRRSTPGEAEPWVRTCCLDSWLSRGWFCRWCGRDQDSGREGVVQGIYGNRQGAEVHRPYKCSVCGTSLPSTINSGSCRACYWVLTRQLVRRLVARFGRWSEIHDSIFCFLTEPLHPWK